MQGLESRMRVEAAERERVQERRDQAETLMAEMARAREQSESAWRSERSGHTGEMRELRERIGTLECECSARRSEAERLTAALAAAQACAQAESARQHESRRSHEELLAAERAEVQRVLGRTEALQRELQLLRADARGEGEGAITRAASARLQSEHDELRAEHRDAQVRSELLSELAAVRCEADEHKAEAQALQLRLLAASDEVASVQRKCASVQLALDAAERGAVDAQHEAQRQLAEAESHRARVQGLESRLRVESAEREALQERRDQAETLMAEMARAREQS